MPPRMTTKIKGTVGRYNFEPYAPFVILDNVEEWMTPQQTRAFAHRLLKAAEVAESKYAKWVVEGPKKKKARKKA